MFDEISWSRIFSCCGGRFGGKDRRSLHSMLARAFARFLVNVSLSACSLWEQHNLKLHAFAKFNQTKTMIDKDECVLPEGLGCRAGEHLILGRTQFDTTDPSKPILFRVRMYETRWGDWKENKGQYYLHHARDPLLSLYWMRRGKRQTIWSNWMLRNLALVL